MDQNSLFSVALGLVAPWKVVRSGLEQGAEEGRFLYVDIDFEGGAELPCPCCGKACPVYDSEVKRWRHLNFWQHATYLSARVPRVECPEHKVRQVVVPWARPESGFTLLFEAFVMALVRDMPVAAVAIDETATRKGHRYATVVVERGLKARQEARLLFMTAERTAASIGEFATAMPAHGAQPGQVRLAAIDMSPAYEKGVAEHLPKAQVVFDRFHVMKLAGEAVDGVRKHLRAQGAELKGALWALRGNWENLREGQRELRLDLCARHKELGRALALRENLQETWEWPGPVSAGFHLQSWCSWAVRSRLAPFKKLARTIRKHWDGILAFFPHRLTSAAIEAINGVIQTARRRARGFRNFQNLQAIAYWMAGHLDLHIPSPFTHPI